MATRAENRISAYKSGEIEGRVQDAQDYARDTEDKFDVLVADHPLLFVVGAFVGGLILGKILSDRS